MVPRFLIQPLVENALKHGLNGMAVGGELKINIKTEGEYISIAIADNGKPFPAELDMGYGLQSTYDKLSLLYGETYQVQITNNPEKHIRILIPAAL
jgi:sensor histidine kinase YesM